MQMRIDKNYDFCDFINTPAARAELVTVCLMK